MEEYTLKQKASRAANICYMSVAAHPENEVAQAMLYRAACIAIDAITMVNVTSHLMPTKKHSYIDQGVWDILGEMAETRQWEAYCFRQLGPSGEMTRRCVDTVAPAIESSVELYRIAQGKLSDATEENWGSILDYKSKASSAILDAFDAFEDAEDVYKVGEYEHAIPGYWASYEGLKAAGLLMGSYDPKIAKLQPYLFNMDHLQYLTDMYRDGATELFKIIDKNTSPVTLIAMDSAIKAFASARDAVDLAIANLRAEKLLKEECFNEQ